MSNESLTGGSIRISVDEPSCGGVIIAGLEVVKPRFGVVVVPSVAKRILLGQFTGGCDEFAVGVISIGCDGVSGGIHHAHDIALQICDIIVSCAIDLHSIRLAGVVVEEVVGLGGPVGRNLLLQQLPTLQSVRPLINLRSITCCPPPCNTTVLSMLCHHKSIDIYGNIKNYNSNQCA